MKRHRVIRPSAPGIGLDALEVQPGESAAVVIAGESVAEIRPGGYVVIEATDSPRVFDSYYLMQTVYRYVGPAADAPYLDDHPA